MQTETAPTKKIEIKNLFTGEVIFTAEIEASLKTVGKMLGAAVLAALASGANLSRANLSRANLSGANLYGANLSEANLSEADLYGANLSGADLSRANLSGANLYGANLSRANLSGANLYGANLSEADLSGADLSRANLSRANLSGANLSGANLSEANLSEADLSRADLSRADLSRADLSRAKNGELAIARTRIIPAEGEIIGWKKCAGDVIVKLRIPPDAKRSQAFGRKCRAEFADVIEVFGADVGISQHDGKTEYRAGSRVIPDGFDLNWQEECAPGIHFYVSRIEAEHH